LRDLKAGPSPDAWDYNLEVLRHPRRVVEVEIVDDHFGTALITTVLA